MFSKLKNVTLRPEQQDVVNKFLNNNKKYFCVELPTGLGKSYAGMKVAEILIDEDRKNS